MTYCEYIDTITGENQRLHKEYHDNHYGFPIQDDDLLFERTFPVHIVRNALFIKGYKKSVN